jgi:hypothetical protein
MDENQVKVLIQEELAAHCDKFVGKDFCVEKHKEVTALSEWIKRVDARLWALVILGAGQLLVSVFK